MYTYVYIVAKIQGLDLGLQFGSNRKPDPDGARLATHCCIGPRSRLPVYMCVCVCVCCLCVAGVCVCVSVRA